MKEERIFIELVKYDDNRIEYLVGGGLNDGSMNYHNNVAEAIEDMKNRVLDVRDDFKQDIG